MRYRYCKTLSANSQAARALSTSSIFSPTLISSRKWQRGAMPARANAFPISCWNSVRTRGLNRRKRRVRETRMLEGGVGKKERRARGKREKDGADLNNAPRVYPSSDSSCVSLDFRQQRESAFANFLSPLSVLTLVAVRKSRLIFKRWKEENCWPIFWSIRSLELNLARYFTKVGWCKKDKLYVWKMMKRWKICYKIEWRDVHVQGFNTFVK